MKDHQYSIQLRAQMRLRNCLGIKSLEEILNTREDMENNILNYLNEVTEPWGVNVEKVDM